jgi:2-iminobutanoate/2-iminopropanoate deaminase
MARETFQPDGLVVPKASYSPVALGRGDIVYTAGHCGFDINGELVSEDAEEQARQTLTNMGLALNEAGCGFEDVVKVTMFITDWKYMPVVAKVFNEFFDPPYPARTTIQAGLPEPFWVEIEALACRPS